MTDFTQEQITMLEAPLDSTLIKQRQGGGNKTLSYLSGDAVMKAANRIFGYGKWGYKVVSRGHMVVDDPKKGKVDMYTADVELWVEGASFTFPGGGCGIVSGGGVLEHEKAYKEAETDAMKRALRHYGDQFGLCLYDAEETVAMPDGTLGQVKNVRAGQNNKPAPANQPPRQQVTPNTRPANQPATKSPEPAQQPAPVAKPASQPVTPKTPAKPAQSQDPKTPAQMRKELQAEELMCVVNGEEHLIDWNMLVRITARDLKKQGTPLSADKILAGGDEIPPYICQHIQDKLAELVAAKKAQQATPQAA